jgi:hypothetical protein
MVELVSQFDGARRPPLRKVAEGDLTVQHIRV